MSFKLKSNSTIFNNSSSKYSKISSEYSISNKNVDPENFLTKQESSNYNFKRNNKVKPNKLADLFSSAKDYISNSISPNNISNNSNNCNSSCSDITISTSYEDNNKNEELLDNFHTSKSNINENATLLISSLQGLFLDFYKINDSIFNYYKLLKSSQVKSSDITNVEGEMKTLINEFPVITNKIKSSITSLEALEKDLFDMNLRMKITDYKKTINNKILPKKEEMTNLIIKIIDREKDLKEVFKKKKNRGSYELDDGLVKVFGSNNNIKKNCSLNYDMNNEMKQKLNNISESEEEYNISTDINTNSINEEEDNKKDFQILGMKENEETEQSKSDVILSHMNMQDREKDLNNIQMISNQIKDMSEYFNKKTQEQGAMLSKSIVIILFI